MSAATDVVVSRDELATLEHHIETLEEALIDARRLLSAEDAGWVSLTGQTGETMNVESIRATSSVARVMAIADPLIRRAVNLRCSYVWGGGVTLAAAQEDEAEQDVNAVVQAFLEDEANAKSFSSAQAREELERALATDGNVFHSLVTSPLTGRVQVRKVPFSQVVDIITNPEDADEVWYYKREWTAKQLQTDAFGGTRTVTARQTRLYPDISYFPMRRERFIDDVAVEWDKPIIHTLVNRAGESLWGTPDVLAALPWARGYKGFLEDWAALMKALSQYAFKATAKTKAGAAAGRTRLTTPPVDGEGRVGATILTPEGQSFEAIGKSGATIDSQSGRPLAAMVAAGIDVPVTMLLSDPGVTGARATAETLDEPLKNTITGRRAVHTSLLRTVLQHVIRSAVKAPKGPLQGTITRDPATGREVVRLTGDQPFGVTVDWPSLEKISLKDLMDAIKTADDLGKLPPLVIARLALVALDVDDVDDVLSELVDADGNFVDPYDAAAARSQQAAVAAGDVPQD
ncbi:hypothetical protein [Segeticoccus rhizosphaerae]|uniref:hypothetical protein n=1 Tax=Segeticoccus rhizosphaerae TaxID=1104777 RepID=UPI001264F350|nr:hypothetical protein [Segeticoccus rhizosphaerae]